MKKAYFRVDSSNFIGSGHLMRCLTLAEELKEKNYKIYFICRELPGNMIDLIENKGYRVKKLSRIRDIDYQPVDGDYASWLGVSWEEDARETIEVIKGENPNWLIIDHYALDIRWEREIRPYVQKIMVIDDLANRYHDCDVILDHNLAENMETRYDNLVPSHCKKLLGPDYLLLRPEFREARKKLKKRDGKVKRILIFLGGADHQNITEKAVKAFLMLERPDIVADVVVGKANPYKERIKALCDKHPNLNYHCQVENMAELMLKADLAIGAGGTAAWERCYLKLPTIAVSVAENQKAFLHYMEQKNSVFYIGSSEEITEKKIFEGLYEMIKNNKIHEGDFNEFSKRDGFFWEQL